MALLGVHYGPVLLYAHACAPARSRRPTVEFDLDAALLAPPLRLDVDAPDPDPRAVVQPQRRLGDACRERDQGHEVRGQGLKVRVQTSEVRVWRSGSAGQKPASGSEHMPRGSELLPIH